MALPGSPPPSRRTWPGRGRNARVGSPRHHAPDVLSASRLLGPDEQVNVVEGVLPRRLWDLTETHQVDHGQDALAVAEGLRASRADLARLGVLWQA
eukprot:9480550-Pyramimonas_sp.AAC.2